MRGKKTSDKKVKAIAQAVAIDEEATSTQIARKTGIPDRTIRELIRNDERFARFATEEKKRLKIEYYDLIMEHVNMMREKIGNAPYRDLVGGFKIVHEKAFPEDDQRGPGFAQQIVGGGDMSIKFVKDARSNTT